MAEQIEAGSALYNIPIALRLTGQLDAGALERALTAIVRRHQALRTTFAMADGEPVQVVQPAAQVVLQTEDVSSQPDREQAVAALLAAEARRPFDLTQAPLLRALVVRITAEEHVCLLVLHHIAADGWSMGVLYRELETLYGVDVSGQAAQLPELAVQYADVAAWEREWLSGERLQAHLEYWKQQLEGSLPVLQLPTDRPRPAVQSYQGAVEQIRLGAELTAGLRALSVSEGTSLFMTLLAAYGTLLYRYTGQADLVVGSPVANRNRVELERLIGFFVNMLPLRLQLGGSPSFRELLGRVREVALAGYAHQDVPFEKLVEELQPERNRSYAPLIQVVFALQNAEMAAPKLTGLGVRGEAVHSGTAKYDLALSLEEGPAGLTGTWEYNTDLFDAATIRRLSGCFRVLLEGIVADPEQDVATLPLLTVTEREEILEHWNVTEAAFPVDRCAHELVAQWAEKQPEAVAVDSGEEVLTYRELNRRANQVAHTLRGLGIGPESVVGICMERCPNQTVGQLGIMKAGGAYLPLDPAHPDERLRFMLADAGVKVLVTQKRLAERLALENVRTLCLDEDAVWSGESTANPESGVGTGNLAYVIYTSGSTGRPKGVQIEHRNLLNLVFWHRSTFGLTASDRTTQLAGVGFDAAVWEVWPSLTAGASLHLPDEQTRMEPERLRDWLVARGITVSFLPTPIAEAVLQLEWPEQAALRALLTGGDALRIYPRPDLPFQLVNNYGPTETTVVATSGVVLPQEQAVTLPAIGRPVANTQVYILDSQMQPVPVGVAGELYVGGAGLARGYLGRPELDSERFVANPHGREPGVRLYRTGDLVRYLADGQIEFLGRIDQQVKIRGFRIELGEIEAVLTQHEAVREATVIAREDEPGEKQLVAYYVCAAAVNPEPYELRQCLKQKLPEYMVPAAFVRMEALPLTPNGKVDRRALPVPDGSSFAQEAFAAPHTAVEEELAQLWAEALHIQQVGIHDNFFALGGHSLLATRLVTRVAEAFGVPIEVRHLFEMPTVAGMAKLVLRQHADKSTEQWVDQVAEELGYLSPEEVEELLSITAMEEGKDTQ